MRLHEKYCRALGINLSATPLSLLRELVREHLANYSFSNTEILLHPKKIHSLEPQEILDKIVVKKRGGYCFEHNNLMFHVLSGLGFEVNTHLARVVYGQHEDVPRTHQFNVVRIEDKSFLVDVGFGPYTPPTPVPFGKREECPYWIADRGNLFELLSMKDGKEFVFYTFTLDKCTPADFKISHYYTSTHPESKFVTTLVASRVTENKTIFVNNTNFNVIENGEKISEEISSENRLSEILTKEAGLNYGRDEASFLYQFIDRLR